MPSPALAERGYTIALHYHTSADAAAQTIGRLQAAGTDAAAFACDVADERAVAATLRTIDRTFRPVGRLSHGGRGMGAAAF